MQERLILMILMTYGSLQICWSKHDLSLLVARRLVQDLIPKKVPKDFPTLLKYFTQILKEAKDKLRDKSTDVRILT